MISFTFTDSEKVKPTQRQFVALSYYQFFPPHTNGNSFANVLHIVILCTLLEEKHHPDAVFVIIVFLWVSTSFPSSLDIPLRAS